MNLYWDFYEVFSFSQHFIPSFSHIIQLLGTLVTLIDRIPMIILSSPALKSSRKFKLMVTGIRIQSTVYFCYARRCKYLTNLSITFL